MSLVSFTPVTDGSTATAAGVNTPLSTIYNDYNGNITNANLSASAAIDFSKVSGGSSTALGAWQSWSPTLTNITKGNGVEVAKFTQVGKTVSYYYSLTFGSTTSIAASTSKITLPATLSSNPTQYSPIGQTAMFDTSAGTIYFGVLVMDTTTVGIFEVMDAAVTYTFAIDMTTTAPMTWAVGDRLTISGTYEAA